MNRQTKFLTQEATMIAKTAMLSAVLFFSAVSPSLAFADGKDQVKKLLEDQVMCWNKGDLDGFMKGYWNSESLSFYSGSNISYGWKKVKDRYQERYFAEGKERGELAFNDIQVELIGEEGAFVRAKWKTVMKKETTEGLFTLVLKKVDGEWRIVHDHTSK
jgi:ketosteroid isomerase-like protein